ncbi:hypothetical protein LTR47_006228 [Exophiala xenobiotica]|nr:hypothetical protein LTR47_006228 [Exophiala xenobiotica]KAK5254250.1 hypothetical protein LTS06_001415 [Exophiala xenobiotica]KAK5283545.1 hypothetical protein LTR40_001573 [Exophiala xenobiotica]KAK5324762.1 hypothetical protein LTR93_004237 [Exophiala xenobiotica]KAK5352474.1 hypothetical protein LTR61_003600 [Exophiala xenobiotica]
MPLTANEEALLGNPAAEDIDFLHQRLDISPSDRTKIGKWTIVALILNRTIGSGIFLTPHRILAGTGCVGGALFLWVLGALFSMCALYVWLECGLSMPQRTVRGETEPRGVPRSGGEKNFLEFMFPNVRARLPHMRTTCAFSIMFILMYNLSGNAISFGIQVLVASGAYEPANGDGPDKGSVAGIAISALTFVVVVHMFSRRGGILINNAFAIVKVMLLLSIVGLGIAKAAGAFPATEKAPLDNFTEDVFVTNRRDPTSWSNSLILCMYAYSGFEQPFYVLAETKSPRRYFPKYTVLALGITAVLFMLVNIAYLLAVPKNEIVPAGASDIPHDIDMATLFFEHLFQDQNRARRAMAALIAFSIFGNLIVMTFTAARVKQEIAKEGILPKSLIIATSYTTPWGLWKRYIRGGAVRPEDLEQAPTAAFVLHWFTSVLLVLVTLPVGDPRKAYSALISLYSYTIVTLIGLWVSSGLLLVKLRKQRWHWQERRRYRPWLSPAHAIIYTIASAFMLILAFVPPAKGSPFHVSFTGFQWYLVPAIGITAPLWGILWYWGLLLYERFTDLQLVVNRTPFWMKDPDCPSEYVQQAEVIDHTWQIRPRSLGEKNGAVMGQREADFLED